jgi:hypothetical protein
MNAQLREVKAAVDDPGHQEAQGHVIVVGRDPGQARADKAGQLLAGERAEVGYRVDAGRPDLLTRRDLDVLDGGEVACLHGAYAHRADAITAA